MSTPKRPKRPADFNQRAYEVFQEAIGEVVPEPFVEDEAAIDHLVGTEKNLAAVELGRLGGSKGGKVRAAKLTPHRRIEIARMAAKARWDKRKDS